MLPPPPPPGPSNPPTILLASSTSPKTTYRIPPSAAHPYTSLTSLAHSLFSISPATHTLHLHFEPRAEHTCQCVGRVAPGLWDGGGYFEEGFGGECTTGEFATEQGDGKGDEKGTLVIYACFEARGLEGKIKVGKRRLGVEDEDEDGEEDGRREVRRLERRGDEEGGAGRWWDAVGWWRKAREVEREMEREKEAERKREKEAEVEAGKKGLPGLMKSEIREIVRSELSATINVTLSESIKTELAEMVESKIRKVMDEEDVEPMPERKRLRTSAYTPDTYDPTSLHTVDPTHLPWPIFSPSQLTPSTLASTEILTIDAYSHTKFLPRDLIIGRALPSICATPTLRPLVRATLVNHPQGPTIYAFIPAKYHRDRTRNGEVQIALSDVEVLNRYRSVSVEASKSRIRDALMGSVVGREPHWWEKKESKHRDRDLNLTPATHDTSEPQTFTTIDTYTGSNFETWGILVGTPQARFCKDENVRPVVRAALVEGGQVRLYMPARYGVDAVRSKGEIGVPLSGVDVWGEFEAGSEGRRRERIRGALLRKYRGNMRGEEEGEEDRGEEGEEGDTKEQSDEVEEYGGCCGD